MSLWEPPATSFVHAMGSARRPTGPIVGVVVAAVVAVAGAMVTTLPTGSDLADKALMAVGFLMSLVLLGVWVRFREGRDLRSLGLARSHARHHARRGALIGIAMMSVIVMGIVVTGQATLGEISPAAILPVALFLPAYLVQGGTEEIITRGFLMQVLDHRWGLKAAIVGQAVFFTALHGTADGIGPVGVINLVLIAVFFAVWALWENGLWGVCAFHATWNWCQSHLWGETTSGIEAKTFLIQLTSDPSSNTLITGGQFGPEGSLFVTVIMTASIWYLVRAMRQNRAAVTPPGSDC
ncbi:hypothetical protein KEM60_02874 [Austwickia sp. TVS 96-490-7B]|uniref:CPBP family intramembrane glutamic endopeptidase n=1 Tax=Austwickia sp. TVS 96-490-7B TaxID=2830843 RepID=UPI001C577387|nr:CPBP family intramembrane glutamic endopeptidase [Austwickia sp. TVS 96-490-7B]MBW3086645.1 hypothetical protein [Austwickia sp. TVS 96-490-7B]